MTPVFVDLDVGFEIDALLEKLFEGFASFGRDFFERYALVANDDALLAVALHKDDGADVDALVGLFETFDHDFGGVGDFLIVVQ